MTFDITWIVNAWEEIAEPTIQDRIIACGLLAAEVEAALQEIQAARRRVERLQGLR